MAINTIGRKVRLAVLLYSALFSLTGHAVIEGEIMPVGGPKMYYVNINNSNITNNTTGATIPNVFDIGSSYSANIYCTRKMTGQPVYYTATASILQAGKNPGYLKLNDYMDVKIDIYIGGNIGKDIPVPFSNFSNDINQNVCEPPSVRLNDGFMSGAKGKVTFMITKPIINGINLSGAELAKLYGRVGNYTTAMSSTPMAIVSINSGVITVPDKCTINSGSPISVDFKTIPSSSTSLDGNNYSQAVPIKVKCEGGSFATGKLNIRMGIRQANTASFNHDYLGTTGSVDRSNLGIVMKDKAGGVVAANTFYDIPGFVNNQGIWDLTAAPIAKPGTDVLEGDFQASATVIAEFQ